MSDISLDDVFDEFDETDEKSILALIIEYPNYYYLVSRWLTPDLFKRLESRWVVILLQYFHKKNGDIPSREVLEKIAKKKLSVDDGYAEDVLEIIRHKLDKRDVLVTKQRLIAWTKKRAYGELFSREALDAFESSQFEKIDEILARAVRVTDASSDVVWLFKDLEALEKVEEKLTCGFKRLDLLLNEGGPTRQEVICYMGATNVGKSIVLCNSAVQAVKKNLKTVFVTLELSNMKTLRRCIGALTEASELTDKDGVGLSVEAKKRAKILKEKCEYDMPIYQFPPEQITVDTLYQVLDNLAKTKGFIADVLVLDYADLMLSRNNDANKKDYDRLKSVFNEVRGLAAIKNVLVVTATQTNREGAKQREGGVVDDTHTAESFGKMFATDYVVTINQSSDEHEGDIPRFRFFVAKNRNGPKMTTLSCSINYKNFKIKELQDFA